MVLQDLREPTPCLWRRRLFTAVQGRDPPGALGPNRRAPHLQRGRDRRRFLRAPVPPLSGNRRRRTTGAAAPHA